MNDHSFNKILGTFNPAQKKAVQILDGPLLISAGAGSGKTRVLTYRIALILQKKKALPHHILAVTFTNKAAGEMRHRLEGLLNSLGIPVQGRLWISTFHSLCARILREHKKLVSPLGTFTIYDGKDQLSLVKKVMRDIDINETVYNPKVFAGQIAFCKRKGLGPEHIDESNFPSYGNRFQKLYFHYEKELKKTGAFDFEGLLLETYKMFVKYPELLQKYQEQFKYISIDEYQDTNPIQYSIIKLLAQKHRNICAVGDEDQSIYSWRGADIANILRFDKDFPEGQTVKLEQNYRSTKNIISSASFLINHNSIRQKKKLWTQNATGGPLELYELEDEYQEAQMIARTIEEHCHRQEGSYQEFAIFYRTNAQSRVLEESLRSRNIPYKVTGSLKFYDRLEIKDILAYMKVVVNTKDEVSLKRIINSPRRGIGAGAIRNIEKQRHGKSFYETMKYLSETNQITTAGRAGIRELVRAIEHLQLAQDRLSLVDFYQELLDQTGYKKALEAINSIESLSRLENLQELANAIHQFELENKKSTLEMFLEEMALVNPSDVDKGDEENVTLMTLHVSKGLEFNTVFLTGLEEGLFPLSASMADEKDMEEERRLAYVGMTRAQKRLFLSYAIKRSRFGKMQYNKASPFLSEIPKEYIRFTSLASQALVIRLQGYERLKSGQGGRSFRPRQFSVPHGPAKGWPNGQVREWGRGKEPRYYGPPVGEPSGAEQKVPQSPLFGVGQVVHHPHFGMGCVKSVSGEGENQRVSVQFKGQRIKKFIAKYAQLSL